MKIEYDYQEEGELLYNEANGAYNYINNLKNGKKIKMKRFTETNKIMLILGVILIVIGLIIDNYDFYSKIYYIFKILFLFTGSAILGIVYYFNLAYKKGVKNFLKNPVGTISINKNGIRIHNEFKEVSYKWDKIYYLVATVNVVTFITDSDELIIIEGRHYEEIYKLVNIYNPKMSIIEL